MNNSRLEHWLMLSILATSFSDYSVQGFTFFCAPVTAANANASESVMTIFFEWGKRVDKLKEAFDF